MRHGVRRPEEPRVRAVHLEVVQLPARGAGQGAASALRQVHEEVHRLLPGGRGRGGAGEAPRADHPADQPQPGHSVLQYAGLPVDRGGERGD